MRILMSNILVQPPLNCYLVFFKPLYVVVNFLQGLLSRPRSWKKMATSAKVTFTRLNNLTCTSLGVLFEERFNLVSLEARHEP